ncbi:MAG: hypothetical protein Q9162_004158 [Coniocarpon cinnabarinum]
MHSRKTSLSNSFRLLSFKNKRMSSPVDDAQPIEISMDMFENPRRVRSEPPFASTTISTPKTSLTISDTVSKASPKTTTHVGQASLDSHRYVLKSATRLSETASKAAKASKGPAPEELCTMIEFLREAPLAPIDRVSVSDNLQVEKDNATKDHSTKVLPHNITGPCAEVYHALLSHLELVEESLSISDTEEVVEPAQSDGDCARNSVFVRDWWNAYEQLSDDPSKDADMENMFFDRAVEGEASDRCTRNTARLQRCEDQETCRDTALHIAQRLQADFKQTAEIEDAVCRAQNIARRYEPLAVTVQESKGTGKTSDYWSLLAKTSGYWDS